MAGPSAPKSPEEGAETPVYLALLPSDAEGPHGEFVVEKKVKQWWAQLTASAGLSVLRALILPKRHFHCEIIHVPNKEEESKYPYHVLYLTWL